jgi:hypothetical protein
LGRRAVVVSIATIEVLDAGHDSRRLLACLRDRVRKYNVGISPGQTGVLVVEDRANNTGDLHDFLDAQFDECARLIGVEWRHRLSVLRPL